MKMNLKLITIILSLQVITGLVVFTLTRAYYADGHAVVGNIASPKTNVLSDPTTQDLIDSLKNHPQLNSTNDPAIIDQQANQAFQSRDYAKAAELYRRVIELAPNKVDIHNNLGLTLHYLGRSSEALEILQRGTEIHPEFQRIWLTLGFVQSGVGNYPQAKAAFKRAIDLGPNTGPGISASDMLKKLP